MRQFHRFHTKPYAPPPAIPVEEVSDPELNHVPWWIPGHQWVSIAWFGGVQVITRRSKR
ncbi:MAG: hypothetical protein MUF49_28380 [Oculatellaceae cyanobacterium Prado106]|nr:hypothetical protein [Oculatellaceae cyanobacterium Prado106]